MLHQTALRKAASAPSGINTVTCSRPFLVNTTRFLTTESAATAKTSSLPTLQVRPTKSESVLTQALKTPAPQQLTYLVERTASKNLSIYNDQRSGGSRKETVIKKIQGNAQDLKKDLMNELKFKKDDVNVNPVTGHVKIKGWHLEQVRTWLEARGF